MPRLISYKYIFIVFILLLPVFVFAQTPQFEWAKQIGGLPGEDCFTIKAGASGNIYTAGRFISTVDFDMGAGVYNLTAGLEGEAYIVKSDPLGNMIWAKKLTGGASSCISMTVDAAENVYMTGTFSGTTDFDPGPGSFNLSSAGGTEPDVYIWKLDASGNFAWAKQIGSTGADIAFSIATDPSANVFVSGRVIGAGDFDPGPGTYTLNGSMFILKLNNAGNFVWAKMIGLDDSIDGKIAIDPTGNIYVSGSFSGTVDVDPGPALIYINSNSFYSNSYVLELDNAGNYMWAISLTEISGDVRSNAYTITSDLSGNIYISGTFVGTFDFDPGAGVFNLTSTVNEDMYMLKLNAAGDFVWAKRIGGDGGDLINSIFVDAAQNVYATGSFKNTVDFDPGPGTFNMVANTTMNLTNAFILNLNTAGDFGWALKLGAMAGNSITLDKYKNIYTTGIFTAIADFDPGPAVYNLTAVGVSDVFVLKLRQCTTNTISEVIASACNSYTLNSQTYTESGVYTQFLTNTSGCDSTIIIKLTIGEIKNIFNVNACNSYVFNGQTYSNSGMFTDTLVSSQGCDSIVVLNLTISKPVFTTIDKTICSGEEYMGYKIPGTYVDVFNLPSGCDSTRTLNLTVKTNCLPFAIPNAFTPNGDGLNDIFRPVIQLNIKTYSFIIYNRYGQKVYESHTYPSGWDGTYQGRNQSAGSYVYYIRYTTANDWPTEEKGTFLLLR